MVNFIDVWFSLSPGCRLLISHECRGLILDVKPQVRDTRIVCAGLPYFPSFNALFEDFDWLRFRVYEHLDGKTVSLYFYEGQWRVSTHHSVVGKEPTDGYPRRRSTFSGWKIMRPLMFANAGTPPNRVVGLVSHLHSNNLGMRGDIASEFWRVWNAKKYKLPEVEDQRLTFHFKLITAASVRVVQFSGQDDLVLYSTRGLTSNLRQMVDVEHAPFASKYGWNCVSEFVELNDKRQAVLRAATDLDPLHSKGFILISLHGTRTKLPAAQLQVLRHLDQEALPRAIYKDFVELVRLNPHRSYLSRLDFPRHWMDQYNLAEQHVEVLVSTYQTKLNSFDNDDETVFESNLKANIKDSRLIAFFRTTHNNYKSEFRQSIGSLTRKAFLAALEECLATIKTAEKANKAGGVT